MTSQITMKSLNALPVHQMPKIHIAAHLHDFEYCYDEIKRNMGTMYDPIIAEHVLKHWDEVVKIVKQIEQNNKVLADLKGICFVAVTAIVQPLTTLPVDAVVGFVLSLLIGIDGYVEAIYSSK